MGKFLDETGVGVLWECIGDKYGKLFKHCWSRRAISAVIAEGEDTTFSAQPIAVGSYSGTLYYSDTVTVIDSVVTLVDPQSVAVTYDNYTAANVVIGKYFSNVAQGGTVYKASTGAAVSQSVKYLGTNTSTGMAMYSYGIAISPVREMRYSDGVTWEYVYSAQRDTYPDSGNDGTFEYVYCGMPMDNASAPVKMQQLEYVGTGTYNSKNPTIISFDFKPKCFLIHGGSALAFWVAPNDSLNGVTSIADCSLTWDGNTVSFSNSQSAANQANTNGTTYGVVAFA